MQFFKKLLIQSSVFKKIEQLELNFFLFCLLHLQLESYTSKQNQQIHFFFLIFLLDYSINKPNSYSSIQGIFFSFRLSFFVVIFIFTFEQPNLQASLKLTKARLIFTLSSLYYEHLVLNQRYLKLFIPIVVLKHVAFYASNN